MDTVLFPSRKNISIQPEPGLVGVGLTQQQLPRQLVMVMAAGVCQGHAGTRFCIRNMASSG